MNLQETSIQIDVKKAAFERRANNCDTFKEIPNMWPKFYKTYEFREVQQLVGRPENAKTHFFEAASWATNTSRKEKQKATNLTEILNMLQE